MFLIPYSENKSGDAGTKKPSTVEIITLFSAPRLGEVSMITKS